MRHRAVLLCSFFLFITFLAEATTATKLTADEAKNHIGEHATVCGLVASTHYAARSRGNPTFVNLDKPFPHQVFTIVIWGEDLSKFSPRPTNWDGKQVCVTGMVKSYRGSPEIVARSPEQIAVH